MIFFFSAKWLLSENFAEMSAVRTSFRGTAAEKAKLFPLHFIVVCKQQWCFLVMWMLRLLWWTNWGQIPSKWIEAYHSLARESCEYGMIINWRVKFSVRAENPPGSVAWIRCALLLQPCSFCMPHVCLQLSVPWGLMAEWGKNLTLEREGKGGGLKYV